jgi:hypothetical protein
MGSSVSVEGTQALDGRAGTTPVALFESARVMVNGWRSKVAILAIM